MQISGIQCDVRIGEVESNLKLLRQHIMQEVAAGSELIIFPECFTTGYCFRSKEEAMAVAEPIDGPTVKAVTAICSEFNCLVIFGTLERDGDRLFNSAILSGPDGVIGCYRKVHLPFLGVDRFTTPGDRPFEVLEARGVRIGMLICYDGGFPEAPRALALQGADLIALPTNWPPGAECVAEYASNTRAMENNVYFAAVNRIGRERGFSFIGKSRICAPSGATISESPDTDPCVLSASIDVETARTKRIVRIPGSHVIDRMGDRRPEMYAELCKPPADGKTASEQPSG